MDTALAAYGTGLESARKNLAKLGKEAYDAVPAAAEASNSRFRGRKTMLKWNLDKKTVTVQGSDEEDRSKTTSGVDYQSVAKSSHREKGISNCFDAGKVTNALNNQIGSSEEKFKNQDDRNMLNANPEGSVKLLSTNRLCFRCSKPVSDKGSSKCVSRSPKKVHQESDNSSQRLQPRKLLGAAKELMNFMNEDYQRQRPPTKPPVNNNQPLN
ncbi:hypothetical protein PTKIN_Ptkin04bG0051600 [Pterospermum kingtungense]